MGRASSAKKVARAARAGGRGARRGQRPSLLFPGTIALVCVLGVALIVYARSQDEAEAQPPTLQDHWHAAYGIYVCDSFTAPFQAQDDPDGIHSHQDGVIHIHPFSNRVTGENAKLSVFFDAMGAELTDDTLRLSDEEEYKEGEDQCDGEDAIVQVAYWANASEAADTDPQVFTENLGDISFDDDRAAITIAFAPRNADLPPPESIPQLDQLTDVPGSPGATTVPGAPGGTTIPAPPGSAPTTVPTATTTAPTTAPSAGE
jgi:hypothetical protein